MSTKDETFTAEIMEDKTLWTTVLKDSMADTLPEQGKDVLVIGHDGNFAGKFYKYGEVLYWYKFPWEKPHKIVPGDRWVYISDIK